MLHRDSSFDKCYQGHCGSISIRGARIIIVVRLEKAISVQKHFYNIECNMSQCKRADETSSSTLWVTPHLSYSTQKT